MLQNYSYLYRHYKTLVLQPVTTTGFAATAKSLGHRGRPLVIASPRVHRLASALWNETFRPQCNGSLWKRWCQAGCSRSRHRHDNMPESSWIWYYFQYIYIDTHIYIYRYIDIHIYIYRYIDIHIYICEDLTLFEYVITCFWLGKSSTPMEEKIQHHD